MAKYILSDIFKGQSPVTQRFGENPDNYQPYGFSGHEGIDWATPEGTEILAPFDGIVVRDVDLPRDNYGVTLVLWDPQQKCGCWFAHLKSNSVSIGEHVFKGQVVGFTGNTGNSSGSHLHFGFVETNEQGFRVNLDNGYKGFLDPLNKELVEWQLQEIPQTPSTEIKKVKVITDKGLNGRSEASTASKIVTTFTKGTLLDVLSSCTGDEVAGNKQWFSVVFAQDKTFVWSGGVEAVKVEKPKEVKKEEKPLVDKDKVISQLKKENEKLLKLVRELNKLTGAVIQIEEAPAEKKAEVTENVKVVSQSALESLKSFLHLP